MDPVLVCPGCRTRSGERIDVRTLEPSGDVLVCSCGRRYPIVDGVPIVLADPEGFLRNEAATVLERDLAPEVAALLVAGGPDDAPYPRLLEHLSIYLDAHWGDRAEPAPDGGAGNGAAALIAKIAARRVAPVRLAVELGCSVGRMLAELAAGAERVVGVELQFGALRRARRLLRGERLAYGRRVVGRHYQTAMVAAGDRTVAAERVVLACGDALDPPLIPGWFDRVVALNLLDSLRDPGHLVSVVDGLCAPGGEIILSSPYAWQSGVVAEDGRFGGADPAAALTRRLRAGEGLSASYQIEDEDELPWSLRRDARSTVTYRVHYVRARKM